MTSQRAMVEASLRLADTRAERHGTYARRHVREDTEALRQGVQSRAERQLKVEARS